MNVNINFVKKSRTCFRKDTGEPLTEYNSKAEAKWAADEANLQIGVNMVPYRCPTCKKWHLSPKDRVTPSTTCKHCNDSHGKSKMLYETEEYARNRAEIIMGDGEMKLNVYKCPHNNGWHLTSH